MPSVLIALRAVREHRVPDAIVLDALMFSMNGVALYDALRMAHPFLAGRILFLSGAAAEPARQVRSEARGATLLSKLNDFRMVVDAVRLVVDPTWGSTG